MQPQHHKDIKRLLHSKGSSLSPFKESIVGPCHSTDQCLSFNPMAHLGLWVFVSFLFYSPTICTNKKKVSCLCSGVSSSERHKLPQTLREVGGQRACWINIFHDLYSDSADAACRWQVNKRGLSNISKEYNMLFFLSSNSAPMLSWWWQMVYSCKTKPYCLVTYLLSAE